MAEKTIQVTKTINAEDCDPITTDNTVECDVILQAEIEVAAAAADVEYDLSAGLAIADVKYLHLKIIDGTGTEVYPETDTPGTGDLSYKVAVNTNAAIDMLFPHEYAGSMVKGLGAAGLSPGILFFSNAHATIGYKVAILLGFDI